MEALYEDVLIPNGGPPFRRKRPNHHLARELTSLAGGYNGDIDAKVQGLPSPVNEPSLLKGLDLSSPAPQFSAGDSTMLDTLAQSSTTEEERAEQVAPSHDCLLSDQVQMAAEELQLFYIQLEKHVQLLTQVHCHTTI